MGRQQRGRGASHHGFTAVYKIYVCLVYVQSWLELRKGQRRNSCATLCLKLVAQLLISGEEKGEMSIERC